MDAELKAKWVEALRSGKFTQTKRLLHYGGGYCCLGVLACVSGESRILEAADYDRLGQLIGGNWEPLTIMNDDEGKSFPEIADWIEANISVER